MLGTIFNVTSTDVTAALAYVGNIFDDAKLLIILAIGLPLGFWVIGKVIGIVRLRAAGRRGA